MRRPFVLVLVLVVVVVVGLAWADTPAKPIPTGADVPMAEHPERVVDYTLRAKLDPTNHTIAGQGTIVWRNASTKPVNELWLHLYLNAFKNQSSVFMRTPVGGFRGTTVPKEWGTIDVRR